MATTIINPPQNNNSSSDNGMGFLLGIVILVVLGILFMIYGLPVIRQGLNGLGGSGVEINVPDKVDVNVKQDK